MSSSSLSRVAVLALAITAACEELPSDFGPKDLPLEDAAIEPIVRVQPPIDGGAVTKMIDAAMPHVLPPSTPIDAAAASTAVPFATVYPILLESCVGCHTAGKALDLSTPEAAYAELMRNAEMGVCSGDGGLPLPRVLPGDPMAGLLMEKLEGTQTCGRQMPPKALLPQDKLEAFRAWIAAGAAP